LNTIQFGRALEKDEVLRINYVLKLNADRFIAAGNEELLYPERTLGRIDWAKIEFLFPNPWNVNFSTGI